MIVDPISEDEVFERLRARLADRDVVLRRGTLDGMARDPLGRFYTTQGDTEVVLDRDIELDRRAREEGVLKPNEALVPQRDAGGP